MSVEIANQRAAFVLFTATNPPVILRASGVSAAVYNGAGNYTFELQNKLADPASGRQQGCTVTPQSITIPTQGISIATPTAAGDLQVIVTDNVGAAADTTAVYYACVDQFPTEG